MDNIEKAFRRAIKTVNSDEFKDMIKAIGVIHWAMRQLMAPLCPHCHRRLGYVVIGYFCVNCWNFPDLSLQSTYPTNYR